MTRLNLVSVDVSKSASLVFCWLFYTGGIEGFIYISLSTGIGALVSVWFSSTADDSDTGTKIGRPRPGLGVSVDEYEKIKIGIRIDGKS